MRYEWYVACSGSWRSRSMVLCSWCVSVMSGAAAGLVRHENGGSDDVESGERMYGWWYYTSVADIDRLGFRVLG